MTQTSERPRQRAMNRHVAASQAAYRIAGPFRAKLADLNMTLARLRGHQSFGYYLGEELEQALDEARSETLALTQACRRAGVEPESHSLIRDIARGRRYVVGCLEELRGARQ